MAGIRKGKSEEKAPKSALKKQDKEKKKVEFQKEKQRKAASSKKWDEFWVPVLMIAAVVIAVIILIFISVKSGERAEQARERDKCILQIKGDVGEVLVSYRLDKGEFPDKLSDIRSFLEEASPQGQQEEVTGSDKTGNQRSGNDIEESLYDVWRRFYCPSDIERNTLLYVYSKPSDSAEDDFVVIKCNEHSAGAFLKLKELKTIEASLPKK